MVPGASPYTEWDARPGVYVVPEPMSLETWSDAFRTVLASTSRVGADTLERVFAAEPGVRALRDAIGLANHGGVADVARRREVLEA